MTLSAAVELRHKFAEISYDSRFESIHGWSLCHDTIQHAYSRGWNLALFAPAEIHPKRTNTTVPADVCSSGSFGAGYCLEMASGPLICSNPVFTNMVGGCFHHGHSIPALLAQQGRIGETRLKRKRGRVGCGQLSPLEGSIRTTIELGL